MKAKDIFILTLSLFSETANNIADYEEQAIVGLLNIILPECFSANNSIREAKGEKALTDFPLITNLNEEIPYEQIICQNTLPYGLAGKMVLDDGDFAKANYFNGMFSASMLQFSKADFVLIEDAYGGVGE